MKELGSATNLFGVAPRPAGTIGQRVSLKANMFKISYPKTGRWQHYDVIIEVDGVAEDNSPDRNREYIDRLQAQEAATFTPRGVYDGRKNLFSINPYSFHPMGVFTLGSGNVNPNAVRKPKQITIRLKSAGVIEMGDLDPLMGGRVGIDQAEATQMAVTALNYVIRMAPITNSNVPLKGSSFFMDIPGVSKDMAKGLKLYRGFFQSVRPAVGQMFVNIDIATGIVFQPISVFDFAMAHFGFRDPRPMGDLSEQQLISLTRILKGVKVIPTVGKPPKPGMPPRTMTVKKIEKKGPAAYMFDKDGVQMSVLQYMQQQHNARIQFPHAPCAIVNKDAAFPMELLKIAPHQLMKRPVPPELTPEVLNFSTQRPDERISQITRGFQQLQYGQSDYLRGSGVLVASEPARVDARIIPPPEIEFGGGQTLRVQNGTWNMLRKKMVSPRKLACWAIVVFDSRFNPQHAQALATKLAGVMEERGNNVLDHTPHIEQGSNRTHEVSKLLTEVCHKALRKSREVGATKFGMPNPEKEITEPQLIVCVLPFPATELRTSIKRWGDCEVGVATQCVVGKKFSDQLNKGREDQYLNNLVLKVNAKRGGTNFIPKAAFGWDCPTMVMGGDVSHPPAGSQGHPSVSAVVGSMDYNSCQYSARSNVQSSREEMITNLEENTSSLIRAFAKNNKNNPPKHIIFFRDGLSEGQFGTFGKQEIQSMKNAFTKLGIQPALTFVCVAKRHHIRLFGDRSQQDRSGNCMPGTVVDSGITHPAIWDFYLQSHPGLKGTSAPSHYTVLHDEKNYTSDKLQTIAHGLCHIYARATRSVSIPAPVYYADIISARGRFHFTPDIHLSEDGDAEYTDLHYQQAWVPLHDNQRNRMYYM